MSDGVDTIEQRAGKAKSNGLGWIIMTDHTDSITDQPGDLQDYFSQLSSAERTYGIPVGAGAEITGAPIGGGKYDGDALEYRLRESPATAPPTNKTYTGAQLLKEIQRNNFPYSYPVIAHPPGFDTWVTPEEDSPSWKNWTNPYWKSIEVASSNIYMFDWDAVEKWRSYNAAYIDEIATGARAPYVMLANTDEHWSYPPGRLAATWLDAPSLSPSNENRMWHAIEQGKAIVSTKAADKAHAYGNMDINGATIGSRLYVPPYSQLTFNLQASVPDGLHLERVQVYDANWVQKAIWTHPATTNVSFTTTGPGSNSFYFAVFTFNNINEQSANQVITNAIFVVTTPPDSARTISGDWDGDGNTDVAAIYDYGLNSYGNAVTGIWTLFTDSGNTQWWNSAGWDAKNMKATAGDMNGDGKDDLVVFYRYGTSTTGIWVFLANSSGTAFQSPQQWFYSSGWNWDATKLVTGNLRTNNDSGSPKPKDEVIALYNYGGSHSALWGFKAVDNGSGGLTFVSANWWDSTAWNWESSKMVSGPINGSSGSPCDDVVIFYDYGGWTTTAWEFSGNGANSGSPFSGPTSKWSSTQWASSKAKYVPFNPNSGQCDIAATYDCGTGYVNIWAFLHTGTGSNYSPSIWKTLEFDWIRTTALGGPFDEQYWDDIMLVKGHDNAQTTVDLLTSNSGGTGFNGPSTWWNSQMDAWLYENSMFY